MSFETVKKKLAQYGQEQLLNTWDLLEEDQRNNFLNHLNDIDYEEANYLFEKAKTSMDSDVKKLDDLMQPIPESQFESENRADAAVLEEYRQTGIQAISNNEVAVLLLAGGQGTRLGVQYPKGMFSVDLPSGKTLFQIQAERIQRLVEIAHETTGKSGVIPWYIMTSGPTDRQTYKYLCVNDYFGLNEKNVVLFKQGVLPCYDFEGKILLDSLDTVAFAPDGNGGIYRALHKNGILDDMEKRGIKYVHVHSVDNILVKVADPTFIGYCIKKGAECGAKVVKKAYPTEPVGVICKVDGKFQVVEYSEITEKTANLQNEQGELLFNSGNICNHFFSTAFLRKIVAKHLNELKVHVAIKKIPYVDESGNRIVPTKPNGIKIEKFIFDVFQFTDDFVTWEVPRNSEFSALKNADEAGKDCPSTAKKDLLALHKIYIEKAGGKVLSGDVEISPLLSYAGENIEQYVKGKTFDLDGGIEISPSSKKILNGVNGTH